MFDVIIVVKASFVRSARLSPIPGYIRICNGKSFKFFWLFPVRSVCVFRSCQPVIFLFLIQSIFFCLDPTHLWNALSSPLPFVFFLFYFFAMSCFFDTRFQFCSSLCYEFCTRISYCVCTYKFGKCSGCDVSSAILVDLCVMCMCAIGFHFFRFWYSLQVR